MEGYKIYSHKFEGRDRYGNDHVSYTYQITLNRSTEHTQRLWNGIEKGLDMYEKYENTSNPIKKWFIRWFMGYPKRK